MVQCQSILFHVMVWLSCQWIPSVEVLLLPSTWPQLLLSLLVRLPLLVDLQIFRVVFDVIVHIPYCSVGNSDPRMRSVFVHGLNSNFNSVLEVLKTGRDFQYRSNSRVSSDPPFWLRSFDRLVEGCIRDKPLIEIV